MPLHLQRTITFLAIVLLPQLALADKYWDREANIRSAVEDFKKLQGSGNEEVVRRTGACYAAVHTTGLSKEIEYCIAFDAANIEFTTMFYKGLAEKYKVAEVAPPPESSRPIGVKRIVDQATLAKLSIENAQNIYGKAIELLIEVFRLAEKPSPQ